MQRTTLVNGTVLSITEKHSTVTQTTIQNCTIGNNVFSAGNNGSIDANIISVTNVNISNNGIQVRNSTFSTNDFTITDSSVFENVVDADSSTTIAQSTVINTVDVTNAMGLCKDSEMQFLNLSIGNVTIGSNLFDLRGCMLMNNILDSTAGQLTLTVVDTSMGVSMIIIVH